MGVYGGMASWVTCENSCCGPSGTGAFGEEFWNCADIAVLPSGQGVATSNAPVATTTSAGSSACAEEWGQCGGQGWTGSTCCASGLTCVQQPMWFSICEPSSVVDTTTTSAAGSTTATSTSAPLTTSATPATTAINGACAGPWEQCGGNG